MKYWKSRGICSSEVLSFILEKKNQYMCDQIMSAIMQWHWDAGNENVPFLNLQCGNTGGGCSCVCLCFVLQGSWLCALEEGARADKKSECFRRAGESPREPTTLWLSNEQLCTKKGRIVIALFWQPVQSCLCLSAFLGSPWLLVV